MSLVSFVKLENDISAENYSLFPQDCVSYSCNDIIRVRFYFLKNCTNNFL